MLPLPPYPACAVCSSRTKLEACGGCKVEVYCSEAHRLEHLASHEATCLEIQRTAAAIEDYHARPTHFIGQRIISSHVVEPALDALTRLGTYAGTRAALDKVFELWAQEPGGWPRPPPPSIVPDNLPALYLQLGREQVAWNVLRSRCALTIDGVLAWEHRAGGGGARAGEPDAPGDESVFAPIDLSPKTTATATAGQQYAHTTPPPPAPPTLPQSVLAAMVLVKFRVMRDLALLQAMADPEEATFAFLRHRLPPELAEMVRLHAMDTDVCRQRRLHVRGSWSSLHQTLDQQCEAALKHVYHERHDKSFWYMLARCDRKDYSKAIYRYINTYERGQSLRKISRPWKGDPLSLRMLQERVDYLCLRPVPQALPRRRPQDLFPELDDHVDGLTDTPTLPEAWRTIQ